MHAHARLRPWGGLTPSTPWKGAGEGPGTGDRGPGPCPGLERDRGQACPSQYLSHTRAERYTRRQARAYKETVRGDPLSDHCRSPSAEGVTYDGVIPLTGHPHPCASLPDSSSESGRRNPRLGRSRHKTCPLSHMPAPLPLVLPHRASAAPASWGSCEPRPAPRRQPPPGLPAEVGAGLALLEGGGSHPSTRLTDKTLPLSRQDATCLPWMPGASIPQ